MGIGTAANLSQRLGGPKGSKEPFTPHHLGLELAFKNGKPEPFWTSAPHFEDSKSYVESSLRTSSEADYV